MKKYLLTLIAATTMIGHLTPTAQLIWRIYCKNLKI